MESEPTCIERSEPTVEPVREISDEQMRMEMGVPRSRDAMREARSDEAIYAEFGPLAVVLTSDRGGSLFEVHERLFHTSLMRSHNLRRYVSIRRGEENTHTLRCANHQIEGRTNPSGIRSHTGAERLSFKDSTEMCWFDWTHKTEQFSASALPLALRGSWEVCDLPSGLFKEVGTRGRCVPKNPDHAEGSTTHMVGAQTLGGSVALKNLYGCVRRDAEQPDRRHDGSIRSGLQQHSLEPCWAGDGHGDQRRLPE